MLLVSFGHVVFMLRMACMKRPNIQAIMPAHGTYHNALPATPLQCTRLQEAAAREQSQRQRAEQRERERQQRERRDAQKPKQVSTNIGLCQSFDLHVMRR